MKEAVMPLRIVICAFTAGIVLFAGVTIFMKVSGRLPSETGTLFPTIAVVLAVLAVAVRPLLVKLVLTASKRQHDRGQLRLAPGEDPALATFRGVTVAGAAILEGPGLFCIVAFMLSGRWTMLGAGLVMAALIPLFCWPTEERLQAVRELFRGS